MIKRINLIEKKAFSFTYLRLVQICLIVVLLNLLLFVYQSFQANRTQKQIASEQLQLKKLEAKKELLTKRPVRKRVSAGQYQGLVDRIEGTPRWSELLTEISKRLPNTVWLTTFRSESTFAAATPETKDKSKSVKAQKKTSRRAGAVSRHTMEVNGLGADMRYVTEFATNLSQSDYFKNLTLAEAVKQSFGVSFKIQSEIKPHVR